MEYMTVYPILEHRHVPFIINSLEKRLVSLLDEYGFHQVIMYEKFANFGGQKSKGMTQTRGNGILLLLDDLLVFEMFTPKKRIEIFQPLRVPIFHLIECNQNNG